MRILIVSPNYWPENFSAGIYVTELAEALAGMGHEVTALVPFPNYPEGRVRDGYRGRFFQTERHNGVRICRCFILPVRRERPLLLRGLGVISFSLTSLLYAPLVGRVDLVYSLSPPATHVLAGWLVSRLYKARLVIGAKDLLSGWVAAQGRKAGLVVRFGASLEPRMFGAADQVQVISQAHARYMESLGIPQGKIACIPDWANPETVFPRPKSNSFRSGLGLEGRFLVLYSGSMGYSSALESVIEAAEQLRDTPDFVFVLVGEGVKRPLYEQMARERALSNVIFLNLQPPDVFPHVLASADVALITLTTVATQVSSQGKMYNIMAAGRPILAVMEAEAAGADLIVEEGFGAVVPPGNAGKVVAVLRSWHQSPGMLEAYGERARAVFLDRFTLDVCSRKFDQLFRRVAQTADSV